MKIPVCLSALAVLLALAATATQAQVVTPQPAPTIITSAPYTISAPGFYQLGANLVYNGNGSANDAIITINSGNVTLDFAGHYLSGPNNSPGTTLRGVFASERGNINIQNGTVAYCYAGIYFSGNGTTTTLNINQRVTNMLVSYCYGFGVYLDKTNNSEVANCRVSNIGGSTIITNAFGIDTIGGAGARIDNNTVTNVTSSSGTAYGLRGSVSTYYRNNNVTNCQIGVDGGKCEGTLTYGCTTPFNSTTVNVGLNN